MVLLLLRIIPYYYYSKNFVEEIFAVLKNELAQMKILYIYCIAWL